LVRFLHVEAAGGVLLVVSAAAALVWANSAWQATYESLWATPIRLEVGSYVFAEDLGHLVNDLLMALFFFVVGMEIKREAVVGELRDRRTIALPAMAAVGGMVVPAAIFVAINSGGPGADGWGVPMATDIAFALGVVAMLGSRVPAAVKVLLLTLAIVDDIGAIVVIAIFYSDGISIGWLWVAAALAAAVTVLHRLSVTYAPVLVAAGLGLWVAVYESGVHATIAGVVLGLLMPAHPRLGDVQTAQIVDVLENRPDLDAAEVRATAASIKASASACDRAIDALHPWTSFVVVPLFALANAGIELSGESVTSPSAVLVGVVAGLVVGKLIGVAAFAWLTVRLGLARLPDGVTWAHVIGLAAVAGVGFTVSLFIAGLAFTGSLLDDAKAGILAASIISSLLGAAVLARATRRHIGDASTSGGDVGWDQSARGPGRRGSRGDASPVDLERPSTPAQ
jgi:NhaA family Na+:H+ antiporter